MARLGGVPRGLGGGVLDEDVVVVVDEVVVVVEVVESEAEERAVGDGGESWASGAGVGCWCNRCIVVDLCCDCEACSLDAPGVVTPDTAPDISEPT